MKLALVVLGTACAKPAPTPAPAAPSAPVEAAPAPVEAAPAPSPEPAPVVVAPPPDTSGLDLAEGAWKITRVISLGSAHKKTTVPATTECLSKQAPLPAAEPGWDGMTCTPTFGMNNKAVAWSFACSADTTNVTGRGTLAFTGKSFTGSINVEKVTNDGASMAGVRGVMKISGTYAGACTK